MKKKIASDGVFNRQAVSGESDQRANEKDLAMGKRTENNFKKRFGDPPRFNVIYPKKPLEGSERIYRNQKIADAVDKVLTGILGRKPTKDELIGRKRIDEAEFKACEVGKPE